MEKSKQKGRWKLLAVILVCASPAWINVKSDPTTHETIDYVRRKIVRDRARIALYVSGDWHHYARYEDSGSEPEQRVTLGLGGAFLHPTHHLPNHIDLIDKRDGKTSHLTRKARWPSTDQSRWRSLLVVFLAPLNPVFALFMGFVQFGFAWLVQAGTRRPDQSVRGALSGINMRGIIDGLVRSPLALLLAIAMVVAFTIFAKPAKPSRALLSRLVGGLHGAAQVALAAPVVYLAKDVPGSGLMYGLSFAGAVVLLGGFMSATLVGWYFLVTHTLLGMHDNEAFSALRLRSFKGFVRCHIAASGDLTLYPIGIPQVRSRRWRLNSLALPGTSWFSRPVDVRPILIEPPVDVR